MKQLIREFKGLYSNADENDLQLEYLQKANNLRIRTGYIESQSLTTVPLLIPGNNNNIITTIHTFPVWIDVQNWVINERIITGVTSYVNSQHKICVSQTLMKHSNIEIKLKFNITNSTRIDINTIPVSMIVPDPFDDSVKPISLPNPSYYKGSISIEIKNIDNNTIVWHRLTESSTNFEYDIPEELEGKRLEIKITGNSYFAGTIEADMIIVNRTSPDIEFIETLDYGICYLDNDKLSNTLIDDKLVSTYIPDLQKYEYLFYLERDEDTINCYVRLTNLSDNSVKYILIKGNVPEDTFVFKKTVNTNGILKVFTNTDSYWIGKINRKTWLNETEYNDIYCESLNTIPNNDIPVNSTVWKENYEKIIDVTIKKVLTLQPALRNDKILAYVYEIQNKDTGVKISYNTGGELAYRYGGGSNTIRRLHLQPQDFPDNIVLMSITRFPGGTVLPVGKYLVTRPSFKDFFTNWNTVLGPVTEISNPNVYTSLSGEFGTIEGNFIYFEKEKFDANLGNLKIKQTIDLINEGIVTEKKTKIKIIQTVLLDNQIEIVSNNSQIPLPNTDKFFLNFEHIDLSALSKRITHINYYISYNDNEDYEQVKVINLLSNKRITEYDNFFITKKSSNGIYSVQTLGIMYNPDTYKYLQLFDDYISVNNINIALSQDKVYFPAIGNGRVYEDLFYEKDILKTSKNNVIKLSNINNTLGIHYDNEVKIYSIQDDTVGGLLTFLKESLEYGINNYYQVDDNPEGTYILFSKGIIYTNGNSLEMVSEQINDYIENNFNDLMIKYNLFEKELYLINKITNKVYTYTLYTKTWNTFDLVYSEIKKVRNFENDIIIIGIDNSVFKLNKTNTGISTVKTGYMDLGKPFLYKILVYAIFDFEGTITFNNKTIDSNNKRITEKFYIKLNKRIPQHKLGIEVVFSGKLYGIELEFQLIDEHR